MLHIILLILKVIGISLLVILCVFFLLLLTGLFVPVRYKGQGSYFEKPKGSISISWLLHIFSVMVSYDEEPYVVVKLFGVRILKPKPEGEAEAEAVDFPDEPMVSVQEIGKPAGDAVQDGQIYSETKTQEVDEQNGQIFSEAKTQEADKQNGQIFSEAKTQETDKQNGQIYLETKTQEADKQSADVPPVDKKTKKKNIFIRTAKKIKRFFRHLMLSWERFCDKLLHALNIRDMAVSFITDEGNKKTFLLIMKQGKKVIKHIVPRKIKGYITFGFDDPYTTGQILTGAAFLYPLYHKQFSLQPVFDRQVIEGELAFKGRIRMAAVLFSGLRILMDKNFRIQLKRFMNRGGM